MSDLEILLWLDYDRWMVVIAWLMMIFVIWYVAAKSWNQHHREWSESGEVRGRDDEMTDF